MTEREQIKQYIEMELLAEGVTVDWDDDLVMSGLVNSLGLMRLVTFVKQQLGVTIPPEDIILENFASINALAAYLDSQRAGA